MICNYLNKNESCSPGSQYCSCIYTLEFNLDDVVEFVIVDQGFTFQSNHPMHLHGHSFAVLAVNKLNTSIRLEDVIEMDKNGMIKRNLERPPIKDTITVPVGGMRNKFIIY
jgi:L-ascorbate oxidase